MRADVAKVDVREQVHLVAKRADIREKGHVFAAERSVVGVFAEDMRDRVGASWEDQLWGFRRELFDHLALDASEAKTESFHFKTPVIVCLKIGGCVEHVKHELWRHLLTWICRPDAFKLSG
jgi:hypothetical protein